MGRSRDKKKDVEMRDDEKTVSENVRELGKELTQLVTAQEKDVSKEKAMRLLKRATELLEAAEQPDETSAKGKNELVALNPLARALISKKLLRFRDKEVRLLCAESLAHVLRLFAPDAPYSEEEQKEVYALFVEVFERLRMTKSPGFKRCVATLDSLAESNSLIPILDFEEKATTNAVFKALIGAVTTENRDAIEATVLDTLAMLLEESDEIHENLLDTLLVNITKAAADAEPARHALVASLFQRCEQQLESQVQRFLVSVLVEGKAADSEIHDNYHDVIEQLYVICPGMLNAVLPHLQNELQVEDAAKRTSAVRLIGKLVSAPNSKLAFEYRGLFAEFVKRFADRKPEIRVQMLEWASADLATRSAATSSSSLPLAPAQLRASMLEKLQDCDEKVRCAAVRELCAIASRPERQDEDSTSEHHALLVQLIEMRDRLRDKKLSVRLESVKGLVAVFRMHATTTMMTATMAPSVSTGTAPSTALRDASTDTGSNAASICSLTWIPRSLLRCLGDPELQRTLIRIFDEGIMPQKAGTDTVAACWSQIFAACVPHEKERLRLYFSGKAMLRAEFKRYLECRKDRRGAVATGSPDTGRDGVTECLDRLSMHFADDARARDHLDVLDAVKDGHVFRGIETVLDCGKNALAAASAAEDVVKRVSGRPGMADFMRTVCLRLSTVSFGSDVVAALIQQSSRRDAPDATNSKSKNKKKISSDTKPSRTSVSGGSAVSYESSAIGLVDSISTVFSEIVAPSSELVRDIVVDEDASEDVLTSAAAIVSRTGASDAEKSGIDDSGLRAALVRHCNEGSWKLAKASTSALIAHAGETAASTLFRRAVNRLEESVASANIDDQDEGHAAVASFAIVGVIGRKLPKLFARLASKIQKIVEMCMEHGTTDSDDWAHPSVVCTVQMAALRAVAWSVVPDTGVRASFDADDVSAIRERAAWLITILKDVMDEDNDAADACRLRSVAASLTIRLGQLYNRQMTPDVLIALALVFQDDREESRNEVLRKMAKAVRNETAGFNLVSCLAFAWLNDAGNDDASRCLLEWVQKRRRHLRRSMQTAAAYPLNSNDVSLARYPEYCIPYALFLLAHHPDFPRVDDLTSAGAAASSEELEPFIHAIVQLYRPLLSTCDHDDQTSDTVPAMFKLLRIIKRTEDAFDDACTAKVSAVADLALVTLREHARMQGWHVSDYPGAVPLPKQLYRSTASPGNDDDVVPVDGSHLPAGFEVAPSFLSPLRKRVHATAGGGRRNGSAKKSRGDGRKRSRSKKAKKAKKKAIASEEAKPRGRAMHARAAKAAIQNFNEDSESDDDSDASDVDDGEDDMDVGARKNPRTTEHNPQPFSTFGQFGARRVSSSEKRKGSLPRAPSTGQENDEKKSGSDLATRRQQPVRNRLF